MLLPYIRESGSFSRFLLLTPIVSGVPGPPQCADWLGGLRGRSRWRHSPLGCVTAEAARVPPAKGTGAPGKAQRSPAASFPECRPLPLRSHRVCVSPRRRAVTARVKCCQPGTLVRDSVPSAGHVGAPCQPHPQIPDSERESGVSPVVCTDSLGPVSSS